MLHPWLKSLSSPSPSSLGALGVLAVDLPRSLHVARRPAPGQGIAVLDGRADRGAALGGGGVGLIALDPGGFVGEFLILDLVAEPGRIVAPGEVIPPGRVVDAVGDLEEEDEVLGPQVEPIVR